MHINENYTLILNAGSSSLKFSVYHKPEAEGWHLEVRGQIEGIGLSPQMSVKDEDGNKIYDSKPEGVNNARDAIGVLSSWLRSNFANARLLGVGHRIVHGGSQFSEPVVLNRNILEDLKKLINLAPLHQPYNLAAIEAVFERMPDVPQVGCFDTGFHHGHPEVIDLVPLPADIRGDELRRYGFHGLSYEYIASALPEYAPGLEKKKIIVAHLGSGASLCAMDNARSVDCTLGFTALDGLCMGTRPGSLDPGIVLYLFQNLKMTPSEVESLLYKKSGLAGISGISNDMRDLLESNDSQAKLAVDYFIFRIKKEIGALTAVLGGIDGIVFTAGIGENSAEIRKRICEASSWLGIEIDQEANLQNKNLITGKESTIPVYVIPTNEELMIARHTARLLKL